MITLTKAAMTEATRLTREGRLDEAMAVLRGGRPAPDPSPEAARAPVLDMEPPRGGGPWRMREGPAAGPRAPRPGMPDGLRGLMEGLGPGAARPRAPVRVPEGARFEERVFTGPAGSRPYKLYVPRGYDGRATPLLVMLHGCNQGPDDFAAGTRMNEVAEERGLLVAYPGQTKAANQSGCWNWFSAADQGRGGEPSLIAGIVREIMGGLAVDRERVFVAGLSAGGAKAAIMGVAYPDLFRAVGVHSGLACGAASDVPSAFAAMRQGAPPASLKASPVPTIVFHGDRDRTVNPANGDQVIAKAGAPGLAAEETRGRSPGGVAYTRRVSRDGQGRPVLEHWVLHGAGHAWSGGSPEGSYTDPTGPDASREMVRFFLER